MNKRPNICTRCGSRHNRWRQPSKVTPAAYCRKCHNRAARLARARKVERQNAVVSTLCAECRKRVEQLFHVAPRRRRR